MKNNQPGNLKHKFFQEATNKINSKLGILSLSRRWDSTLMWSHYTNSHKGFCIGFDTDEPFFKRYNQLSDTEKIFMPVVYSDIRVKVPIEKGQSIDPQVVLTKSTDWKYEEEERLLVVLALADKKITAKPFDIYLYRVPHLLIREIVVGANIMGDSLLKIRQFCVDKDIKIYQSRISETKFDMEREIF